MPRTPPSPQSHDRSDLFIYDSNTLHGDILLAEGPSRLTYKEYAVFAHEPPDSASTIQSSVDSDLHDRPFLKHVGRYHGSSSSSSSDPDHGDRLFHQSTRQDHALDADGLWTAATPRTHSPPILQGRLRHIICNRRASPHSSEDLNLDGLHLSTHDYTALGLHPATLQYVRRSAVESMFWDRHHAHLSIILALPADPRAPHDFLSLTHGLAQRTTTALLVRRSGHGDDDEYDARMRACAAHWAHPLVTPVVLLQVQFARTEGAVAENHGEVVAVERDVGNMAGFDAFEERQRPGAVVHDAWASSPRRRRTNSCSSTPHQQGVVVGKKSTELMKNAHDVLKRSIRLLDTLNWMERAINVLLDAGDELDDVRQSPDSNTNSHHADVPPPLSSRGRVGTGLLRARIVDDPLTGHWHEIRQYLEGLLQLCKSLKTDRTILEMRCKALVDIIYSKMAQEDNNLNARMAVASSRDSSSMKALAVITAVFLPGEFMSSLFGMGIFDWATDGASTVVGADFWVYWATTVPLTILILVTWRAWWVGQDRHFRKHLSRDLSEERYWTDDRRPRRLETSFLHDFLYMSVRRGETSSSSECAGGGGSNNTVFPSLHSTRGCSSDDAGAGASLRWLRKGGKADSGFSAKSAPPQPTKFRLGQMSAFEGAEHTRRSNTMV